MQQNVSVLARILGENERRYIYGYGIKSIYWGSTFNEVDSGLDTFYMSKTVHKVRKRAVNNRKI